MKMQTTKVHKLVNVMKCRVSYADKKGKYQKQQDIVLPKL